MQTEEPASQLQFYYSYVFHLCMVVFVCRFMLVSVNIIPLFTKRHKCFTEIFVNLLFFFHHPHNILRNRLLRNLPNPPDSDRRGQIHSRHTLTFAQHPASGSGKLKEQIASFIGCAKPFSCDRERLTRKSSNEEIKVCKSQIKPSAANRLSNQPLHAPGLR